MKKIVFESIIGLSMAISSSAALGQEVWAHEFLNQGGYPNNFGDDNWAVNTGIPLGSNAAVYGSGMHGFNSLAEVNPTNIYNPGYTDNQNNFGGVLFPFPGTNGSITTVNSAANGSAGYSLDIGEKARDRPIIEKLRLCSGRGDKSQILLQLTAEKETRGGALQKLR